MKNKVRFGERAIENTANQGGPLHESLTLRAPIGAQKDDAERTLTNDFDWIIELELCDQVNRNRVSPDVL